MKQVSVASLKSLDSNLAGAYGVMENLIKDAARKKFKKSDLNVVIEFMDKKSEKKQSVEVPLYDWEKFQKVSEFMNVAVAAPKILSETSLQQIVNQWEYLLGGFIRARFETNSDLINGQTLVSYEKIKCLKNIDEVKRLFADQIVGDVMGRNFNEQLKFFKEEFKVNMSEVFPELKKLKEGIFRRHMIVHCGAIATTQYCNEVKKLGLSVPKEGITLFTDFDYVLDAWDLFFAAGVILSHLVAVNFARSQKDEKMEADADSFLLVSSYNALIEKRYNAAKMMLEYANARRIASEWEEKALRVNLALVYKRMGRVEDCEKVLDERDWSSYSEDFLAPIYALRGDYVEVGKIMKKRARKDRSAVQEVMEWPVYEDFRNDTVGKAFIATVVNGNGSDLEQDENPKININAKDECCKKRLISLYNCALGVRNCGAN